MLTVVLTVFQGVALAPKKLNFFFFPFGILALVGINLSLEARSFQIVQEYLWFFNPVLER